MTKLGEVYFCKTCGNKVKVLSTGMGTLVCCGKPMALVTA
jgi:superoxide reductase